MMQLELLAVRDELGGSQQYVRVCSHNRVDLLQQEKQRLEDRAHHKWLVACVVSVSFGLLFVVGALFLGRLPLISWQACGAVGAALVALTVPLWKAHSTAFNALLESQRRMHEVYREAEVARRVRR